MTPADAFEAIWGEPPTESDEDVSTGDDGRRVWLRREGLVCRWFARDLRRYVDGTTGPSLVANWSHNHEAER